MSQDDSFPRRDVLKGAAAGGLTVAAAATALSAGARAAPPAVSPPGISGRDESAQPVFALEFDGETVGYFTECSGIGSEHEIIEHKVVEQKDQEVIRKIPGRLKWTDVTLKRGVMSDLQIWQWRESVVRGKIEEARGPVSIVQYSSNYLETARWNFQNAWPSKVSAGSEVHAACATPGHDTELHSLEEVTFVHEGMYRET